MTLSIKTCGLRDPEHVEAALARGATHIGFIFFERSPRHIALSSAALLRAQIDGRAETVAVTVDATDEALAEIVAIVQPSMLQLHGNETPGRINEVSERFGLPIIKALALREPADFDRARGYAADVMLFDAKPPVESKLPGGNGVTFDWAMLRAWDSPFWISGGITPDNVGDAIATGADGIDLSSGIEEAPGQKSVEAINRFFDAIEAAQAALQTG